MSQRLDRAGKRVLLFDAAGAPLEATTLIEQGFENEAAVLAIPSSRLGEAFFDLRTGIAGEVAQKALNYGFELAIIGDISAHLAASNALRDWVREANRGTAIGFYDDLDAFMQSRKSAAPAAIAPSAAAQQQ